VHGSADIYIKYINALLDNNHMMLADDSSSRKVSDGADKNPVILNESTNLAESAGLMKEKQISNDLVGRDSQYGAGIVTERDILYHVTAELKAPSNITLKEIMSSPLISG